jgi:hypothetical protein
MRKLLLAAMLAGLVVVAVPAPASATPGVFTCFAPPGQGCSLPPCAPGGTLMEALYPTAAGTLHVLVCKA